jgi:16S rRNA (guanine1207-N2)-methyltransferase
MQKQSKLNLLKLELPSKLNSLNPQPFEASGFVNNILVVDCQILQRVVFYFNLTGGRSLTEHYYSAKPKSAHELNQIQIKLRGKDFTFITDAGVFSKKEIDFGSKLLIETMVINRTDSVLDVGCGYGPIGLSAAVLADQGRVTMIDINERAVHLSRDNAERNGINNVTVLQSDVLEQVAELEFNCVLTNPPIRAGKEVVHRVFSEAFEVLAPGGSLWVVIQKKQGAPSAFAKLETIFGNVQEVTKEKGYRIFSESYGVLLPGGSLWVVIQKKQGAPSAFTKLETIFGNVQEVTKDKGYRIFKAIKNN